MMAHSYSRLFITGGAGFIGSCFAEQAAESGQQVMILDKLTYAGNPETITDLQRRYPQQIHFIHGAIEDAALVTKLLAEFQPEAVVHFAAESHVDNSIAASAAFIETNVVGTHRLLEVARHYYEQQGRPASFRFIQISTDEVYGALGAEGKFSEATPMQPNSPYSASKAAGDHLARAWFHTYGLPTIITNCSNNYGPRQHPEKLIPRMIACALSGQPLPVYGRGENVRDWIYVGDHCRGISLALERGMPGETYCFGGNAERRNIDVVQAICALLDDLRPRADSISYATQIAFVEDRLGHDWRYAIDDTKAEQALGFSRAFAQFEDGLKQTVEWYLNHQDWCSAALAHAA